ncbi:pectin lyase-like protein [Mycena polygramma]|nr:pectin lyase-like protein [Mycena polygramma]
MFAISPRFVCAALALLRTVSAVGTPFGLAAGTTGGGSAIPSVPSSLAELTTWLSDSTARVILLESIYDFTSNEGTTTGTICKPWTCSPNPQARCENYEPSAAKSTATYYVAGTKPLVVASNKTLLGKGSSGGIKGKGLKITGANNIIIQNIKITDINAEYVWDALQIDGGSNIWFQHIGRQMVVTGYGAVTKTTRFPTHLTDVQFSNNVFNGDSTYSATCNGCHYWVALFTGAGDQITFALNYLYKFCLLFFNSSSSLTLTVNSGLADGGLMSECYQGTSGYFQDVHVYNNYFVSIAGHAIDPEVGSKVLLEGNYFNTVTTPTLAGDGQTYIPTTSTQAAACSSLLGRNCVTNTLLSSGSLLAGTDTGTLNGFTAATYKSASIMAASAVPSYVQAHAGVGIVN